MKREDLIKMITDNFAEGEEVCFRYFDDQGSVISTDVAFDVDESTYVEDGYWTFYRGDEIIRDHVAEKDYTKVAAATKYQCTSTKWTTTKSKIIKTKVIDVAC